MHLGLPSLLAPLFTGLATWMTIASVNNATDTGTNTGLIGTMLSMRLLSEDPPVGEGLRWRAIDAAWARPALYAVIVVQVLIALAMWRASALEWRDLVMAKASLEARQAGNLALAGFMGLWLAFMAVGFWFAYWMRQGVVQQVHMSLLQIGILAAVLNNIGQLRTG